MLLVTKRWPMCSEMTTRAAGSTIRIEPQSKTGKTGLGKVRNEALVTALKSMVPGTQKLTTTESR